MAMATAHSYSPPRVATLVALNRVLVQPGGIDAAQASLSVAVRVRPILRGEMAGGNGAAGGGGGGGGVAGGANGKRDIVRVMEGKVVVVLDPDAAKEYLDQARYVSYMQ